MKWMKRWEVVGDSGTTYTVAQDVYGGYGCSCPRWKFKRVECKHIRRIKSTMKEEKVWRI